MTRYPLPNVFSGGREATVNNYVRVGNEETHQDQFDGRLDRHFGERHRVFGRYAFLRDDSRPIAPLPDGSGVIASGIVGNTVTRADSVAGEHNWTMSAARANQLRFGFTRRFTRETLRTGGRASESAGIPALPLSVFSDVLPAFDIVGFQQLGSPANGNAEFTTSVTQLIDNHSWIRGRHSFKLGADIRFQTLDILQPPSPSG